MTTSLSIEDARARGRADGEAAAKDELWRNPFWLFGKQ